MRQQKNKGKSVLISVTTQGEGREEKRILVHLLKEQIFRVVQTLFHNHLT